MSDTVPVAEPEGPKRADAVRNREKVIAAATEVFAEQGIEAGIPEIAERAGVGKGTVYRNFETKDDLIAAILVMRLTRMERDIVEALDHPDPEQAIRDVLEAAAARTSAIGFPPSLQLQVNHPELEAVKEQLKARMGELFEAARSSGDIRSDASVDELFVLFGGACRVLAESGQEDPAIWTRHANLVVDAFRPVAPSA